MKKTWKLLALGAGVYLLFALVTLPASVITSRLGKFGINIAGVSGTVWKGSAQVVQANGVNVGGVSWNLHTLYLFTGRINADVKLNRSDGFAEANVSSNFTGKKIDVNNLMASLPLQALQTRALPGNFAGMLNLKLSKLVIEDRWPTAAEGTMEALDLYGPANKPQKIGSYQVIFAGKDTTPGVLTGALTDLGNGPLQVRGKLELKAANKTYLLDGKVATGPNTPPDVVNALQFLEPPDENGFRPLAMDGSISF